MKERVISGVIFAIIGILILVINNPILDTVVVTMLALVAMYEYNHAFKNIKIDVVPFVGYLSCLLIPTIDLLKGYTLSSILLNKLIIYFVPTLLIAMFCYIILTNLKINIIGLSVTVLSLGYIPLLFSYIKRVLVMPNGRALFMYVIIAAFVSDMAAYFVGRKIGKHKLCKDISPKKSIEGAVAGVVSVVITFVIVTVIYNKVLAFNIPVFVMAIAGFLASIAGQFGDLSASSIKRYCKVKDFGKIMPGHGGILDRFDSIIFVAPIIYIFLNTLFNV